MPRGGYRVGAGRPKGAKNNKKQKPAGVKSTVLNDPDTPEDVKAEIKAGQKTPLQYMLDVMNMESADMDRRDKFAIQAAPYIHPRATAGFGKKDEKKKMAKKAGQGRFAPARAPKLAAIKGGK